MRDWRTEQEKADDVRARPLLLAHTAVLIALSALGLVLQLASAVTWFLG